MKVELAAALPSPVHWLVVPVWEGQLDRADLNLGEPLRRQIERLRESGDLSGKAGESVTLFPENGAAERVLLLGLGPIDSATLHGLGKAAGAAAKAVTGKLWDRVALALPPASPLPFPEVVRQWVGSFVATCQPAARWQAEPKRFTPTQLLIWHPTYTAQAKVAIARGESQARAVSLARQLVNAPPNELYPGTFAQRAQELAGTFGFQCEVLDEKRLEAERMACLLGVAQGSARPPRLVVLRYGSGSDTLGLVGKGVTFDSGGLSLKPNEGMIDMKCDMAGAAAVLAAFTAIVEQKLPGSFLGVLALVENMPSGTALKLGDILKARNGKTVEIYNTDAEGRLILADALDYAITLGAKRLVDLATLTGACMVALGTDVAGLFGNNDHWRTTVRDVIWAAGERAWELPLFKDYQELLKSHFADLKNVGGKYAGAITAAKFLEQFVGVTPWCHLDIAGPAWVSDDSPSRDAGGTGCFVASLIELARNLQLPWT